VHALLLLLLHALALHRAEEKRSHTQEDHSVSLSSYLHMDDDDDTTAMRSWLSSSEKGEKYTVARFSFI
jgi:hypothetical protein